MKFNQVLCMIIACSSLPIIASQLSLAIENDALGGFGDNDYTHGTCFEFIDNSFMHYKLGQNMYAPSDLTRSDHIVGDRPYAGIIYGGIGYELFRDLASSWSHYAEIDFGMIGPSAYCKETQKLIHRWLNCRDPQGWDNQLHDEFVVNGQWWTKYNWHMHQYVALVPRVGVLMGTIQDAVEVGCDLKVGWNLQKDVGSSIMFSTSDTSCKTFFDKIVAYAYVGIDERYYLYNHFLEGSLFSNKDDKLGVDIEPFVGELQCGACIKYGEFSVKYYMIFRQAEFNDQKNAPNYAGLVFAYEF